VRGNAYRSKGEESLRFKRILCPLDLESANQPICDLALQLARNYGSEIVFAHFVRDSIRWPEQEQACVEKLTQFIDPDLMSGVAAQKIVVPGDPAAEILETVQRMDIDLVVMGHHTRMPLEEYFMGSVAKTVVTESECPVLVVRSRSDLVFSQV